MQPIENNGYTRDEVIIALHSSPRMVRFRYDLLDRTEKKKSELKSVMSGQISMESLAVSIKKTAIFVIKETGEIDWLNDRIQPFCGLRMPDGGWAEWPLGVFLLSSPSRQDRNNGIIRNVEAYDGLQILLDDKFIERHTIDEGTKYIEAINAILVSAGITKINIAYTEAKLRITKEFEIGTEKLRAVNELLQEINYTSLWVNENGYYISQPYSIPALRPIEYTYKTDSLSVIKNGLLETVDYFNVPNHFIVVSSNAESDPLTSVYINNNPESPISTVSLQRSRVYKTEIDDIADQKSLDEYTKRIAYEASQVFGYVAFRTSIMPFHGYSDLLYIDYAPLDISDRFIETSWRMPLKAGAEMEHTARRVIQV
jgi:hypothetical protein